MCFDCSHPSDIPSQISLPHLLNSVLFLTPSKSICAAQIFWDVCPPTAIRFNLPGRHSQRTLTLLFSEDHSHQQLCKYVRDCMARSLLCAGIGSGLRHSGLCTVPASGVRVHSCSTVSRIYASLQSSTDLGHCPLPALSSAMVTEPWR